MLAEGQRRKAEGFERVSGTNRSWVQLLRDKAVEISNEQGSVCADDLRKWADAEGLKPQMFCDRCFAGNCDRVHQNAWGIVFIIRSWIWTGETKQSEYTTNNAREIKIWRYRSTEVRPMQLFQLKKATKPGQCEAMRCTGECGPIVMTAVLWGLPPGRVGLCVKHQAMAEDFARKTGFQLEEGEQAGTATAIVVRETEGAKLTGFNETKGGASAWLARVYEVIQELEESLSDGKEVVEIVKGLSIETHADLETVGTFAQDVQAQVKTVVALEKEITAPIATALARIRDAIKPTKTIWADAMVLLRAKLEAAALKQEARNKAAQAEAAALAEAGEDPTAAIEKMTNTADISGVSLKIKWRAEVKDAKLMPDEYVIRIPNEKKLKEYCAAAEGEPEPMSGVEFVRDVDSRIQATKPS